MSKPLMIAGGLVGLVVLAAVAVVAVQLIRSDDPNLATEAPLISSPSAQGGVATGEATSAAGSSDGAVPEPAEGVRHFIIVPAESEAKYVVRESLRGIQTNAVGTTRAVEGDIYLTAEGLADGQVSSFRVDLSTLQSDEGMRDNYIKRNTLQTDQYPYAEFVIEEVSGFPADYLEDTEVKMPISGILTIRDVSNPVTWAVKARPAG